MSEERKEIFPFLIYLPNELFGLIICEWLGKLRELKQLDVAITNRLLRNKYYETLKQVKAVSAETNIVVGKAMQVYVDWFKKRFISTRLLNLYKLHDTNVFQVLDSFHNLNHLHQLTLWSTYEIFTNIDILTIVKRLPQLLKLRLKYIQFVFPSDTIIAENKSSMDTIKSNLHYLEIGDTKNTELELETIFSQLVGHCSNIQTLLLNECSTLFPTLLSYLLTYWPKIHTLTYINKSSKLWNTYHRRIEIVKGLDVRNKIHELTQSNTLWKRYQTDIEATFTAVYPQVQTIELNVLQYNVEIHWYYGLPQWFPNAKKITFLDNRLERIDLPRISATFLNWTALRSLNFHYCDWTCDELMALLCENCVLLEELTLGDHPICIDDQQDDHDYEYRILNDNTDTNATPVANIRFANAVNEDEIIRLPDENNDENEEEDDDEVEHEEEEEEEEEEVDDDDDEGEDEEGEEEIADDYFLEREEEFPLTFTENSFRMIAKSLKYLRKLMLDGVTKLSDDCIDAFLCDDGQLTHLTDLSIFGMYAVSVDRYIQLLQCEKFTLRKIQLRLDSQDVNALIYRPYAARGEHLLDDLQRAAHDIFNTLTSLKTHHQSIEELIFDGFSERSSSDEYDHLPMEKIPSRVLPAKLSWSLPFPNLTKLTLRYIGISTTLLQQIINRCQTLSELEIETTEELNVDLISFAPVSLHLQALLLSNASADGRVVLTAPKIEQIVVECALLVSFYWSARDFLDIDEVAIIKAKYQSRVCFQHPDWTELLNHENIRSVPTIV